MAFVQNGSFESLNQSSRNLDNNNFEPNPLGLKNFSSLLDSKFGNSAFSDNLLSAPSFSQKKSLNIFSQNNSALTPNKTDSKDSFSSIKYLNPFDKNSLSKFNPNKDYSKPASNKNTIIKKSAPKPAKYNPSENLFDIPELNSFKVNGFNKGTGMASSNITSNKLDFCY